MEYVSVTATDCRRKRNERPDIVGYCTLSIVDPGRLLFLLTGDWLHTAHEVPGRAWSRQPQSAAVHPPGPLAVGWSGSAAAAWWRRGRAPSWPDSLPDTPCGLRRSSAGGRRRFEWSWTERWNAKPIRAVPAEKAMKASLFLNLPSSSRKWEGLKAWGLSHSFSSCRTEVRRVNTVVSWQQKPKFNIIFFIATLYTSATKNVENDVFCTQV